MSAETIEWLNSMTLIGFTDNRGNAWHYRAEDQGDESNHYPGAIPVEDVTRRLFNFEVNEAALSYRVPGVNPPQYRTIPGRKAMVASDNGDCLGVFKDGYQGHSYREWLLDSVATILDDDLQIGSAGLLRNRAQAWVSVEVPESIITPEGVEFRPHLIACTSYDGSLATTYKRAVQFVVCDNTLSAGLAESGQTYRLKHTKYSGMKLMDARAALAVVHDVADVFHAQVASLTAWKIDDVQYQRVLDTLIPVPADEGRGQTVAIKKRDQLSALYANDERVAPWNGTAFGVLQAFNTWNHHFAQVRKGVARSERNMENVLKGKYDEADSQVLKVLQAVAA